MTRKGELDSSTLLEIYRKMTLIKCCDESIIAAMMAGKIAVPYYSARGQEAIPAAISAHLSDLDYVATIYRGGHDMLAKGVPVDMYWAEVAGRKTGTCKGKGGPMHITHPETGCMVTTGVVGSSMPIACGLGLAAQMRGEDRVTICNFGDGASNIGAFHESLNLASLWKLPVIFVCQNNGFAEHTSYATGTSIERIADRAAAYSMPGVRIDGNNVVEVYEASGEAIARARRGEGPTLIEAMTFRFNGHLVGDMGSYIPPQQLEDAKKKDPYPSYRQWLQDEGCASASELDQIDSEIQAQVQQAEDFALNSPMPDVDELTIDVYAGQAA